MLCLAQLRCNCESRRNLQQALLVRELLNPSGSRSPYRKCSIRLKKRVKQ